MNKIVLSTFSLLELLLVLIVILSGCKITMKNVQGSYTNSLGDTLVISPDSIYDYKQKLWSGDFGWNTGKVNIQNNKVIFSETKPFPVVGFKMQIKKINESSIPYIFSLLINNQDKNALLDSVHVYANGKMGDNTFYSLNQNKLMILNPQTDSIIIFNRYLLRIDYNILRLKKYNDYSINILPAERLFDLDKYKFTYTNSKLTVQSSIAGFKKIKKTLITPNFTDKLR
ncbi:MAG: hypothetical protein Q8J87_10670 [Sediminibacterium sp.]|nr:hypothetical protein [Sediminibacterium sp.]